MQLSIQDAIAAIQTILAVGAFIFAYREFKQWRIELVGSEEVKLAIKIAKSAVRIQDTFRKARSNFGTVGITTEESFNKKLDNINNHLQDLYELRWDAKAILSEDIAKTVSTYTKSYNQLRDSMHRIIRERPIEGDKSLVFEYSQNNEEDEFQKEIDEATEKLLEIAQRYIRA